MKGNTSTLVEGSLQLAEALVQNQGQLEQVVGDIKNDSNITRETLEKAQIAKNTANEGEHIVKNMTRSIAESCDENQKVQTEVDKVLNEVTKIVESIKLIQDKTQLINDIVFQTKLLSFNASVEAARAGEHGKGFSVVAEEVGKLAEVSGKASLEIHEMIEDSVKQVEEIVDKSGSSLKSVIGESTEKINATKSNIDKCNELFLSIIGNVNNIHSNITEVSRKAEEKVVAIDEVNDRFVNLKLVSEQSSTVAHTVSNLTNKLQEDSTKLEQVSKDLNEKFGT